MAGTTVGSVKAEFVGDASSVTTASKQAADAINKVGKAGEDAGNKVEQGTQKATQSFADLASSAQRVGQQMTMKVTLPMLATGAAAIKASVDFHYSLSMIEGLVGIAGSKVEAMGEQARDMAIEFGVSGIKSADALYFITSAGLRGTAVMETLQQSLKASAIGLGDVATVADTVSSALNAYGKENISATDATDVLVATVREGKLETTELAGTMGRVLPIASEMGVEFHEVGAAFAAMSLSGLDAAEAATATRQILASLLKPSKQAEDALRAMGTSSSELRDVIRNEGLFAGLSKLRDLFGDNEEASALVFGNIRALAGVLNLMGANVDTTRQIFERMEDNVGDTDLAFQAFADTAGFKMKQASAQLKDAMITLGDILVPVIVPAFQAMLGAVKKVTDALDSLPNPIKNTLVVLAGLIALVGPALLAFAAFGKALIFLKAQMIALQATSMSPWILGITAALAGAVALFTLFSGGADEAKDAQRRLNDALREAGDPAAALVDNVSKLVDEYYKLSGGAEVATPDVKSVTEGFVAAELAGKGLQTQFDNVGISISELTDEASLGSDLFGKLEHSIEKNSDTATRAGYIMSELLSDSMREAGSESNALATKILDAYEASKITGEEMLQMVAFVDLMSDAVRGQAAEQEKAAKDTLANADAVAGFIDVLGPAYDQIVANALATADAEGIQNRYAYALDAVRVAIEGVVESLRPAVLEEERLKASVMDAEQAITLFNLALAQSKAGQEEGQATVATLAKQFGILGAVMENQLALIMIDAETKSEKLLDGLGDLEAGSVDLERAVRSQIMAMLDFAAKATNAGGEVDDIIPTLRRMYDGLLAAGEGALGSRDKMVELISTLGLLDGLTPEVKLLLTADASELQKVVDGYMAVMRTMTSPDTAERFYNKNIAPLQKLIAGINKGSRAGSTGGGGGGGGGATKNAFQDFIEGWKKDIESFIDQIDTASVAQALMGGGPEEIGQAIKDILDSAVKLGIRNLPSTKPYFDAINEAGAKLFHLAKQRKELQERYDKATQALEQAKSARENLIASTRESMLGLGRLSLEKITAETAQNLGQIGQLDLSQLSPSAIKAKLSDAIAKIKDFRKVVQGLSDRGFPQFLIGQVIAAGPVDGTVMGQFLLDNSSALDITDYGRLASEMAREADISGTLFGNISFNSQIATLEGTRDVLRTALYDLNGTMLELITAIQQNATSAGNTLTGGAVAPVQIGSVTVVMPPGSSGTDVVAALQDYNRRYGSIPVNTRAY